MLSYCLKKWLIVLLLSILCQSVNASFDQHVNHQTSGTHSGVEHVHDDLQIKTVLQNVDCQHCSHCHHTQPVFLDPVHTHLSSAQAGYASVYKMDEHTDPFLTNLLRPPSS